MIMALIPLIVLSIFLFADSVTGKSGAICPNPLTVAEEGDDVTLGCHLDPEVSVVKNTVDWKRDDSGGVVYCYRHRKQDTNDQMPQYRNRTTMNHGDLTRGELSLHISSVQPSDSGRYRCFVSKMDLSCYTTLTVVSKDQQKQTKTEVSSTTGPPGEDVPESEDHGGGNREAGRAAVISTVVFLLCGLVVVLVLRSRAMQGRMETLPGQKEPKQSGHLESNTQRAERDGDQEGPAANGLTNV